MSHAIFTHAPSRTVATVSARLRADVKEAHLLFGALMLGAGLRFAGLGQESYWIDEITMLSVSGRTLGDAAAEVMTGRPPAFVLLLHWWIGLVGTSEVAARALTAIIGVASLALLYVVGRSLVGGTAAVAATAVMALAPIQLYQSQNVRYYALVVLLAIAAAGAMVRLIERAGPGRMAAYVAAAVLLVLAHTYGVFVIAAHNLYMLLCIRRHRSRLGAWVLAQGLTVALVSPFLWVSATYVDAGGVTPVTWLPPVVPANLLLTLVEYVTFWVPGPLAVAVAAACLGIGTIFATRAPAGAVPAPAAGGDDGGRVRVGLLLTCWLLVPLLAPYLLSVLVAPMYHTRYTLGGSPALYLLIGLGVVRASRRVAPGFGVAAVCALIAPATVEYYPRELKEDWRGASAFLDGAVRADDRIMLAPGDYGETERALRWYFRSPVAACDLDERVIDDREAVAREVEHCAAGADRVWLVVRGPETLTTPFVRYVRQDWTSTMRPVLSRSFTGIDLYLVERAEAAR
jgi:mannosyltransferase